jgi:hypothetical protein
MGVRELLRTPQDHADFLVEFVVKRLNLRRLPGAPAPHWQLIIDRADKFKEFRERRNLPVAELPKAPETPQTGPAQTPQTKVPDLPQVESETKGGIEVSNETLVNAMAQILIQCSGVGSSERAVSEAKYRILYVVQHKKHTAARTFDRLIRELEPCDFSTNPDELNSQYAEWLLRLALDIGREPSFIYGALGAALHRAKLLKGAAHEVK